MADVRPPLSNGELDRDAGIRADPAALAAAWREPAARLLLLRGVEVPVTGTARGAARLALVPTEGEFASEHDGGVRHCYLGRMQGAPVFAASARRDGEGRFDEAKHPGAEWRHPFEVAMRLSDTEREAMTVALALFRWHEAAGFSPSSGHPTAPVWGGWARHDEQGGEHFPRTDPAVIVLVEHEGRVLLGSNALWETGRFSLLAGFVEAGESAEQAVQREIWEEAGVRVGRIEYVTSQPWPFPRSLMLGFRAGLAEGFEPEAFVADAEEISELRWFTRAEIREPMPGVTLPQTVSIARWMLDRWANEDESAGMNAETSTSETGGPHSNAEGRDGNAR